MKLAVESQRDLVSDETRARIAMVRPVLRATLLALDGSRVGRLGGFEKLTLADLGREYREGSGDCGICFEYAVHDAIRRRDVLVLPRIEEVLDRYCKINGDTRSILFGAEKGKKLLLEEHLVETDTELLTDDSRLYGGRKGKPTRLKKHLETARQAFHKADTRQLLPRSIRGLWRADLFVGAVDRQQWVATTLKTNPLQLEGDAGIRIGIFPERQKGEGPGFDERKNLVLCPLPYDNAFMELFYSSFFLVKSFLLADARLPRPVALPYAADRQVAKMLEERRAFAVLEVISALEAFAQPGLLESSSVGDPYSSSTTSAVAPVPRSP